MYLVSRMLIETLSLSIKGIFRNLNEREQFILPNMSKKCLKATGCLSHSNVIVEKPKEKCYIAVFFIHNTESSKPKPYNKIIQRSLTCFILN